MGLSWINPLYLSGLALLAIPVLIHLALKQHEDGLRFPSLMFLQRIPRREKHRFQIRDRLLLLLRCLLLLLLVLAFARPLLSGGSVMLDPGRSDSVILLDRSWSMRLGEQWDQAQAIARDLVADKHAGDRIGLILFDDEAEILIEPTADAADLRALLARAEPGYRATRLPLAIEQAARLLDASNAADKRIYVISDFQAAAAPRVPRIAPVIEVIALPVAAPTGANAALTSLVTAASSASKFDSGAADEFALVVEIGNFADESLATELRLTLDGRERARRQLQLPPGASVTETFDRLGVDDELLRGVVSLGDDALALDNRAYFVYSRAQRLPLLIVEGANPRANQALFLDQALRLTRDPAFGVERVKFDALEAADLEDRAVVVLHDTPVPGGETGRALAEFVDAGGALVIALGETAPAQWRGEGVFAGLRPGARIDARRGAAFQFAEFESTHPLATALGARETIDLSLARVFSYRAFEAEAADRVVARYDDGGVALLERRVGKGRLLLLTTTLDPHWNDLALQPAFLPFLHRALAHIASYESYANTARVGDFVDLLRYTRALAGADALVAAANDAPLIVELPSTQALRLERDAALLRLDQPGFYQVHQAAPDDVEITLAVNLDAREANPARLDVERLVEEIRAAAELPRADAAPTQRQAAGYEREQQLWYAILLALLALLLIEALFANWIGIRRSARGPGAA